MKRYVKASRKRYDTVDEIRKDFIKKGWNKDIDFTEATEEDYKKVGFTNYKDGRKRFIMKGTGNWYNDDGKIYYYNIEPAKNPKCVPVELSTDIECVGHNDPGKYFDLVDYFDVWGNEEDGWEVNDQAVVENDIWISDDTTERELLEFLAGFYLNPSAVDKCVVEWNDPDFIEIFDADTYMPICRLQASYSNVKASSNVFSGEGAGYTDFTDDEEKMYDFYRMSKDDFLRSYSYLTEEEYDATKDAVNKRNG